MIKLESSPSLFLSLPINLSYSHSLLLYLFLSLSLSLSLTTSLSPSLPLLIHSLSNSLCLSLLCNVNGLGFFALKVFILLVSLNIFCNVKFNLTKQGIIPRFINVVRKTLTLSNKHSAAHRENNTTQSTKRKKKCYLLFVNADRKKNRTQSNKGKQWCFLSNERPS